MEVSVQHHVPAALTPKQKKKPRCPLNRKLGGLQSRFGRFGGEKNPLRYLEFTVPSSLLYSGYRVTFSGVKRPGSGVDHPLPPSGQINPLNTELNPICPLLELFGAHHILQVSS